MPALTSGWTEVDDVEGLGRLTKLATSLPDFEEIVSTVTTTASELFDTEKAGVMLFDPVREELVLQRPAFGLDDPEVINQYRVRLSDGGNAIRVFTTLQPYLSNDCAHDPQIIQRFVGMFGSRKVMTVPLKVADRAIGVLHVTNKRAGNFTRRELEMLETLARHFGTLIERARLFQVVQRNEREAQTLYELSVKLAASSDPDDIASAALPTAATLLDAGAAGVVLESGFLRLYLQQSGRDISRWARRILSSLSDADDENVACMNAETWRAVLASTGLAETQIVPMATGGRSVGILVAGRSSEPFSREDSQLLARLAHLLGATLSGAQLHKQTEHAYLELRALHDRMEQVWKIHERLTAMVLAGHGTQELSAAIAELVGNPLLIEDNRGVVVGRARAADSDADAFLAVSELTGRDPEAAKLLGPLPSLRQPVELRTEADGCCRHIVPVTVGGEPLALMSVIAASCELSDLDLLALNAASTVVALVFMRERAVAETERRLKGELLTELLTSDPADEHHLLRRAGYLGYDLEGSHAFLVVRLNDARLDGGPDDRHTAEQLRVHAIVQAVAQERGWLMADWNGGVVALIPVEPGDARELGTTASGIHSVLKSELQGRAVVVGVSRVCAGVRGLPSAYREVERLLGVRRSRRAGGGVVVAEELGLYRILLHPQDGEEDLMGFAVDRLGPLREHDAASGGDLIGCLRAFLQSGGQIKVASEALHYHRNSLRCKLKKIEDLAAVDLHDPETRFQLQLALTVLDVFVALEGSASSSHPASR
jgi:sugar diacid utilization regulator/GAF domain-containing protein